jgi:outer membrane beta-barrel protein
MKYLIHVLILTLTICSFSALAEDSAPDGKGEKLDTNALKNKYWARGDSTQLGVVQNRTYSKARKFALGMFGGTVMSDPWLNTTTYGASLGYHFNEFMSAELLYMKDIVGPSSALELFRSKNGRVNTNEPKNYYGAEGVFSLIYGKVSLLGSSIIYYDMHMNAGLGRTSTDSGSYLTPSVGLGQRYFISQKMSIRLDYRMMIFREQLIEQTDTSKLGTIAGTRTNFSNTITLGLDYLLEVFK